MQQIMWETILNQQFERFLESHGIDKSDNEKVDFLKKQLNITRRSSCSLLVEVDENWEERLIQLIKK